MMDDILKRKIRRNLDYVKKHGWGVLDLRNCGLEEIPKEVFEYTELVNIDLGNDSFCGADMKNRIKIIPDQITNLKKLARLNLENNEIVYISD